MILLILGVLLWTGAHYFKRLMPEAREKLGARGKGLVTAGIVAGIILMIVGYGSADFILIWSPPAFMVHVNNTLMVFAFWTFGSAAAKGAKVWPANKIRHPQLASVMIWAVAHLLVNGDLASIILFGGLLGWAVGSVILINRAEPNWSAPETAGIKTKIRLFVITLIMFSVVAAIHAWLGVWPFPS
jgi:uncharacterized membrane protein